MSYDGMQNAKVIHTGFDEANKIITWVENGIKG